jgi:hypothetical protein
MIVAGRAVGLAEFTFLSHNIVRPVFVMVVSLVGLVYLDVRLDLNCFFTQRH